MQRMSFLACCCGRLIQLGMHACTCGVGGWRLVHAVPQLVHDACVVLRGAPHATPGARVCVLHAAGMQTAARQAAMAGEPLHAAAHWAALGSWGSKMPRHAITHTRARLRMHTPASNQLATCKRMCASTHGICVSRRSQPACAPKGVRAIPSPFRECASAATGHLLVAPQGGVGARGA